MTDGRQYEDTYGAARLDPEAMHPVEKLRDFIERDRIDAVAVIWMLCIAATIASGIWTALSYHVNFPADGSHISGWERAFLLSQTATLLPLIGVAVGLA